MLEARLASICAGSVPGWESLARDSFKVQQLHGGLTNRMFVVSVEGVKGPSAAVVRVHPMPNPAAAGLAWASSGKNQSEIGIFCQSGAGVDVASLLATPQAVFIDREVRALSPRGTCPVPSF